MYFILGYFRYIFGNGMEHVCFNQLLTFHVWLIKTRKYLTGMYRLKLCHVLHKGTCIPTSKSFPDSVSSKIIPVCIVALNLGLKTRINVEQRYILQFAYIYISRRGNFLIQRIIITFLYVF